MDKHGTCLPMAGSQVEQSISKDPFPASGLVGTWHPTVTGSTSCFIVLGYRLCDQFFVSNMRWVSESKTYKVIQMSMFKRVASVLTHTCRLASYPTHACAAPHHHLIAGHLARYRPATVDSQAQFSTLGRKMFIRKM